MSLSWFSCRSFILVELEFGDVGFCGGLDFEPGPHWLEASTLTTVRSQLLFETS